jgi:hypothetical protein
MVPRSSCDPFLKGCTCCIGRQRLKIPSWCFRCLLHGQLTDSSSSCRSKEHHLDGLSLQHRHMRTTCMLSAPIVFWWPQDKRQWRPTQDLPDLTSVHLIITASMEMLKLGAELPYGQSIPESSSPSEGGLGDRQGLPLTWSALPSSHPHKSLLCTWYFPWQ